MMKLTFIAAGGAAGALLRYGVAAVATQWSNGNGFPVGTLVVNLLGCLAMGLLGGFFAGPQLVPEHIRVGLLVGVLGAFTTFSTFGGETFQLINDGEFGLAALNVGLSNVCGIAAVWLGYRASEAWFGV